MKKIRRKYGWCPSRPDHRDFCMLVSKSEMDSLPTRIDLTSDMPPVYDQMSLGSCTANAIGAAYQFEHLRQKLPDFIPSRLFIYYNERALEGTINQDSGAMIRDGMKVVAKQGVCPETDWPYIIKQFAVKPSAACYKKAQTDRVLQYLSVSQSPIAMKACLAAGYPIVLGISVYESFESAAVAKTGIVPMPKLTESMLGGHAVCCIGYDDTKQVFIMRNSWGTTWGMAGYFTIPYRYLTNPKLCSDLWTIRMVQ